MIDLRSIRHGLGMTQQELAQSLGVSRQLLSMVEMRQRYLPVEALLKLQEMMDQADSRSSNLARQQRKEYRALRKTLKKRLRICRLRIGRLQRKFTTMINRYQKALASVKSSRAMLDRSDSDPKHWQKVLARGQRSLERFGLAAQALLEVKIIALEAEVEALEERLRE